MDFKEFLKQAFGFSDEEIARVATITSLSEPFLDGSRTWYNFLELKEQVTKEATGYDTPALADRPDEADTGYSNLTEEIPSRITKALSQVPGAEKYARAAILCPEFAHFLFRTPLNKYSVRTIAQLAHFVYAFHTFDEQLVRELCDEKILDAIESVSTLDSSKISLEEITVLLRAGLTLPPEMAQRGIQKDIAETFSTQIKGSKVITPRSLAKACENPNFIKIYAACMNDVSGTFTLLEQAVRLSWHDLLNSRVTSTLIDSPEALKALADSEESFSQQKTPEDKFALLNQVFTRAGGYAVTSHPDRPNGDETYAQLSKRD